MAQDFSNTASASANAQSTAEVWLILLTITHASLSSPLRFVNNNEDIVSRGNTYAFFPFDIELPGEDADQPTKARLRIDNVSREIIKTIRSITTPPTVSIEVILASQPDTVEVGYYDMSMRDVDYDVQSISGELVFEPIFTEPVTFTMTPGRFPGLF
jgi:hypothetical protein